MHFCKLKTTCHQNKLFLRPLNTVSKKYPGGFFDVTKQKGDKFFCRNTDHFAAFILPSLYTINYGKLSFIYWLY